MSALITKNQNSFQVLFYNEESKENIPLGTFKTIEEAEKKASDYEIEFYKSRTNLLPKGVSIAGNVFTLNILVYTISKSKSKTMIASCKTLSEMKKLKLKCLSSIIG
jgi:predicted ATPase with chaperone activity